MKSLIISSYRLNIVSIRKSANWPFMDGRYPLRMVIVSLIGLMLLVPVIACGMGARGQRPDAAITLEDLQNLCGLPAPCGAALPCEGRMVTVKGYVDGANIFSKKSAPASPHEKFKVSDHNGRSIEVWGQGPDNSAVFDKLARRPSDLVRVTGRLAPFNMPVTGGCTQGVKVVINNVSQIQFN